MFARLLVIGRPAAASRVAVVEPSAFALCGHLPAAPSLLDRDGGRDASTSYSSWDQVVQPWNGHWLSPRRTFAALASHRTGATASAAAGTPAISTSLQPSAVVSHADVTAPGTQKDDPLDDRLDMEALMRVLLHPLPLGRVCNPALLSGAAAPVVQYGKDALFFDPTQTLSSTMRALHIVRQVLRSDGHVLVVNPNPAMRPLLREAAHLCLNRNVWFWYRDWQPGAISDPKTGIATVFDPNKCQPNRRLMSLQGLALRNPLCAPGTKYGNSRAAGVPALSANDMQRLMAGARSAGPQQRSPAARERRLEFRSALQGLLSAQTAEARLLSANSQPSRQARGSAPAAQLALVLSLDLSYGGDAVREAYERNIPTVSLLNGHSDASRTTYPVYASEAHAGFQHFFLDWLLRVVNMPPPRVKSVDK